MIDEVLDDLAALVACDTRNPPRETLRSGIIATLVELLPSFDCEVIDHGFGSVSLLAQRGTTDTLFNVHIDTVPTAPGWVKDPFALTRENDRVYGLGACDIKGAAACLTTAARHTSGAAAFLFTSDEEAGNSRCVSSFCANSHDFCNVIVAEPTGNHAVLAHRGYAAATAQFRGVPGHGSEQRARDDNALHHATRFSHELLALAASHDNDTFADMSGLRLNIGRITGGIKANMIAADAEVCFGVRPLPSHDLQELLHKVQAAIPHERLAGWETTFFGPPLPAHDADAALQRAADLARGLELPLRDSVNFWSEAALFSAAGMTSFVFGPGDIAQAHTADEWVAVDQLQGTVDHYTRIIGNER